MQGFILIITATKGHNSKDRKPLKDPLNQMYVYSPLNASSFKIPGRQSSPSQLASQIYQNNQMKKLMLTE
jgi:hypothetical protein